MNWYKMSHYILDWNVTFAELKKKLGRDPSPEEVRKAMLRKAFPKKDKLPKIPDLSYIKEE